MSKDGFCCPGALPAAGSGWATSRGKGIMTLPWKTIDRFTTPAGETLELRQRGARDFLIVHGGQVLMNSRAQRSEIALGRLGCRGVRLRPRPRVLIGGLGMGITLRAALDCLPAGAQVVVAELHPRIVDWCRGALSALTHGALSDPRVEVVIGDVADRFPHGAAGDSPRGWDAVILDLYHGPDASMEGRDDPLYGRGAIARMRAALAAGGTLAVWGEDYDAGFVRRLARDGFAVTWERPGRGGYRHVVYLAVKGP
jgi:spermidine synthase